MPRPVRRPEQLRGRVFRGTSAVRSGLLTADCLRGPGWVRLFPDVYADATLDVTHTVRARAVGRLLLPHGVLSGASAAALWGLADLALPEDDVEVTVAPGTPRGAAAGVAVRRRLVPAAQVRPVEGVRATAPETTALELAARLAPDDAVVLLDRFVAARLTTLTTLQLTAAELSGRGCRRARQATSLADGLAGSPQETRLRLLLHRSPLPRPVAQHVVRRDGVFVARVDFAWPARRIALEYEGAWHTTRIAADRRRLEGLQAAGWRVLFVTAADLHSPADLLARIAAALGE
ncbi:endonuclease domain-containing protein [Modestobacter marinus]|uniref:endonuclease domain-containing protein n=1 Tax=Modestobacter marinus TaxID=477641 RepID=UPI00201A773F|nr:type IV toxin-antitoxin system AbiEi family antitoxin [Modestobacter marinus]